MTLFVLRVLLFAGGCFAASLLLPALAYAVGQLFPRRAAMRHLVWVGAFGALLALPLLALVVPPLIVMQTTAAPVAIAMAVAAPVTTASYSGIWDADALVALLFAPLCLLWLAGLGWNLLRLALGLFGLHRLRRGSAPFDGRGDVRLAAEGPLAFGCLRPVILLPHQAAFWPRARLEAVLAHERAHVRRRDNLWQLLAHLACAFYWPSPLVCGLSRFAPRSRDRG